MQSDRPINARALRDAEASSLRHRGLAIKLGSILKEMQARGLIPADLQDTVTHNLRSVEALEA